MVEVLPSWIMEASKLAGVGGIIFLMWYLTQKWSEKQFDRFSVIIREERSEQYQMIQQERSAQREDMRVERDRTFELIREERKNDYATQQRISEAMSLQAQLMAEIRGEMKSQGKDIAEIKLRINLKDKS